MILLLIAVCDIAIIQLIFHVIRYRDITTLDPLNFLRKTLVAYYVVN